MIERVKNVLDSVKRDVMIKGENMAFIFMYKIGWNRSSIMLHPGILILKEQWNAAESAKIP